MYEATISTRLLCLYFIFVAFGVCSPAQNSVADGKPDVVYRKTHQQQIISELVRLLSIPNTANDQLNILRNADELEAMLRERGFRTQRLQTEKAPPVIFGEISFPGATRTLMFYCHYDGQPADATAWSGTKPFIPSIRDSSIENAGKLLPFPSQNGLYGDEWRIYARSAADDKAPIVGILTAIDTLKAKHVVPVVNVKMILDGEEEAGSPHLGRMLSEHQSLLKADLVIAADGPTHQSGRVLIDFGNRGIASLKLTVYGPVHALHSGHYGNWAPNPAMRLSRLLSSMQDANGRVRIPGFYDDVAPLGKLERTALRSVPNLDKELLKQFEFSKADTVAPSLNESLTLPSLNIDGLASGWSGEQPKTIIPDTATAWLDMRLVKNIDPSKQFLRLVEHVRHQGYIVIDHEPSRDERMRFPLIARINLRSGYPAARTAMDIPAALKLVEIVNETADRHAVLVPTLGGSVPMYVFEEIGLPVIGLGTVNFDDNQHAADENLRLRNFWDSIDLFAAILEHLDWKTTNGPGL